MKKQKIEKRLIDLVIEEYDSFHQKSANRALNYICIPLIVFSVVGFVWSIPFPSLKFLGSYIVYLNWGSFLVAFSIYYYVRLSPILSYVVLLILFGMVYIIIQMQTANKASGYLVPQVCVFLFAMANVAQFIGYRIEGRKPTFSQEFKFMLTAPIWLLSLVLKKFGMKY